MRKIYLLLFCLTLLSSCAQSTALIGPAISIGNTGNVMQAGYSYGSNMLVKSATGKTPTEHMTTYVQDKKEERKIKKEFVVYLESHIESMRNKLSTIK